MRLPQQVRAVARGVSTSPVAARMQASGCDVFKKIGCAGAIAACGAVCVGSLGTACVECLAGIGASGCLDCF